MAPLTKRKKSKTIAKGPANTHGLSTANSSYHHTTQEGHHEDDEEITADDFPFSELIPNWEHLDPNSKNPALGKNFSKGHHSPQGGGGKDKKHFKNFESAFCLEWIKSADGNWSRCYNQFTVDSNQCITHPKVSHKDGPNQIYREVKEGRSGNWGMLKNNHIQQEKIPPTPAEIQQRRADEIEAKVTQRCADGEDYGAAFLKVQAEYREKDALARKVEKQEARVRSSPAAGNAREQSIESVHRGRSKSRATPGIAALEQKMNRNPNQRGTFAKGSTKLKKLSTITEE